jgi:signal transduction histidine kinase
MNLLVNASQAIEGEGDIWVTTRRDTESVLVSIRDNGVGISREDVGRIFDPFFTTKGVGEGTGLGLSISYGIVRRHGGEIWVESEEGIGTTFFIKLPIEGGGNGSQSKA